jgi:chromosome segregation ATPase
MALNLKDLTPEVIIGMAEQIKSEQLLQKLREKHEMLKIRSEIEGIDNKEELENISNEISKIKEEEVESSKDSSFLTKIYPKESQIKKRLEKLEKRRPTIQPEVYQSLKDEYLSELNSVSEQLNLAVKQLEIARQQTQPLIQVLKFQIEELAVRKDIEDLAEEEYEEKNSQLESELNEKEKFLNAVEYLLEQVKP